MEDVKTEIVLMQKDFMNKLKENVLYSENENGLKRLGKMEQRLE